MNTNDGQFEYTLISDDFIFLAVSDGDADSSSIITSYAMNGFFSLGIFNTNTSVLVLRISNHLQVILPFTFAYRAL
jgi:hypothetical protein